MFKKFFNLYAVFCMLAVIILPGEIVFAQTASQSTILQNVEDQKRKLEAELSALEIEIAAKQKELAGQKGQSAAISSEIALLTSKIKAAKVKIQERDITIKKLTSEIGEKSKTIVALSDKLDNQKDSLAQLLRKTDEIEQTNIVHIVLSRNNLSDFYKDLDSFSSLQGAIKESVNEIKGTRVRTEEEKKSLEEKQDAELDARKQLEAEQRKKERDEQEQKKLLNLSKNKEQAYETILKGRQRKAAEIRSALFALRDTAAIPFGQALDFATLAQTKTGVRPALILAILEQESNMGANIGTCNRPNDPPEKNWRNIMPGPEDKAAGRSRRDDQSIFLKILEELGLVPEGRPLSCPWGNGWGGAMGPSQFIPSTWQMFKTKIATAIGVVAPNPWEPKHAIMATAIYLGELGAAGGGYSMERNAACRYYSGRSCDNKKPANAFYGDGVMTKAQNIQENMINVLQNI